MPRHVVIGLGNPGPRYAGTRHNAGFEVLDALAKGAGARFKEGRADYLLAEAGAWEMLLIRPTTYMNLTGSAVSAARVETGVESHRMLVVLDDIALPLGSLRLRRGGSDGGHNGLASVLEALGTLEVPRLRLGVGPAHTVPTDLLAEFVLSRFEPGERPVVDRMVGRAAEATKAWAAMGIEAAMNVYNTQERDLNEPDH
jgi:PTH1 family peptidyl-tRNA hydrolase